VLGQIGHGKSAPLHEGTKVAPALRCVGTSKSGRSCTNLAAYADQRCPFHSSDPVAAASAALDGVLAVPTLDSKETASVPVEGR